MRTSPNSNYTGPDSFLWTGSDGIVYAATPAAISITVAGVNALPAVTDNTVMMVEGTPHAFAITAFTDHYSDPDGDELARIQITRLPEPGTLTWH